jgi:hypothetical protein
VQLWTEWIAHRVDLTADPAILFRLIAQPTVGHRPGRLEPRAKKAPTQVLSVSESLWRGGSRQCALVPTVYISSQRFIAAMPRFRLHWEVVIDCRQLRNSRTERHEWAARRIVMVAPELGGGGFGRPRPRDRCLSKMASVRREIREGRNCCDGLHRPMHIQVCCDNEISSALRCARSQ